MRDAEGKCVMPEITFTTFIMSFHTSALYHLGELPHPESGEKVKDMELAKHTIDTLSLLEEKTRGNLEKDEDRLLSNVIYELKMRFVKASGDDT